MGSNSLIRSRYGAGRGDDVPVPVPDYIYWSQYSTNTIHRVIGGSTPEQIAEGVSGVRDVLVADGSLFWAAYNDNKIYRANLDGTNPVSLPSTVALGTPTGLAYHDGYIYWTEHQWGVVQRASLQPNAVNEVLVVGIGSPEGLCIAGERMYWTEPVSGVVRSANLDGSDIQILLSGLDSPAGIVADSVYGLFVSLYSGWIIHATINGDNAQSLYVGGHPEMLTSAGDALYWADFDGAIYTAPVTSVPSYQSIQTGLSGPYGIGVVS